VCVYFTTVTRCQHNYSKQIYQYRKYLCFVVVEFLTEILPLRINFTKYTKLIGVQDFVSYFLLNHWKIKYTNLKLANFSERQKLKLAVVREK